MVRPLLCGGSTKDYGPPWTSPQVQRRRLHRNGASALGGGKATPVPLSFGRNESDGTITSGSPSATA